LQKDKQVVLIMKDERRLPKGKVQK